MSRVLVILPTSSYRTPDFVAAARALDIELAIASEQDPPLDLGDRFVRIDCSNPSDAAAAIVALADRTPIDAVVAADDAGVVVAALAAERLGLDHHPSTAAEATRDKLAMRRLLAQQEVNQPAFMSIEEPSDELATRLGYPLVIKPRTGTASRGVLRVDGPAALGSTFARVRSIADDIGETGPLLAEAYIDGSEVAVEGIVVGGRLTVLAVFDKPDTPQGPTFEETLMVTPSQLPEDVLAELERVTAAAVTALGLAHGPIHAEARIDPSGRVYILEVAARSIGGLCSRSIRFGLSGTSLEELILAAALGRPQRAQRQPRASGVMMIPVMSSGVFEEVIGVDEARLIEGITEIDISIPPGTVVAPLPEGDRYLGFIFGVGPTPDHAAGAIRRAAAALTVKIADQAD